MDVDRTRFSTLSASCLAKKVEGNLWTIIDVRSEDKGKGHASLLMERVTNWADELGHDLILKVQQNGNPHIGMGNEHLEVWYETFGFERVDDVKPIIMIRRPASQEKHTP